MTDTGFPYGWSDLRERPIGALAVGDVIATLTFPSAYWTGGPDGRIASAMGITPCGFAWTITARDGNRYTARRHDRDYDQTEDVADLDMVVLAVVPDDPPKPAKRRRKQRPEQPGQLALPTSGGAGSMDIRPPQCEDPIHATDQFIGTCTVCRLRVGVRRHFRTAELAAVLGHYDSFWHRRPDTNTWCRGERGWGSVVDVEPNPNGNEE